MSTFPLHLTILTGASRGMGLAMAQQLLQPGHQLLCLSRNTQPALEEAAHDSGALLEQWNVDLADGASAAERLIAWLQALPAHRYASATLINNAGVIPALVPLRDSTPTDLAHALRVGLEAPMQLCAAFLAATREWKVPRKVLNVSSGLGRRAMASQAGYCAVKAGMDHFTRCLVHGRGLDYQRRKSLLTCAGGDRHRHASPAARRGCRRTFPTGAALKA